MTSALQNQLETAFQKACVASIWVRNTTHHCHGWTNYCRMQKPVGYLQILFIEMMGKISLHFLFFRHNSKWEEISTKWGKSSLSRVPIGRFLHYSCSGESLFLAFSSLSVPVTMTSSTNMVNHCISDTNQKINTATLYHYDKLKKKNWVLDTFQC